MADQANPTLRAMVGAAALLLGLVALFTLSGVVGRIQRNEPGLFVTAILLITAAAACYVFVELLAPGTPAAEETDPDEVARARMRERRKARARRILVWAGPLLGVAGIVLAVIASVASTRARERPVVTGSLATTDRTFTATVKAASLPSDERVAVIVDGLRAAGDYFEPHTVYQAYIGPDQEGKIDHAVTLTIPRLDDYEAVGVKAYSGPTTRTAAGDTKQDTPCQRYPRRVSLEVQTDTVTEQGPGCVIIQVAPADDAP